MSDSIVIIPTYNEKENIENIIRAVFGLEILYPGAYTWSKGTSRDGKCYESKLSIKIKE